VFYIHGYLKGRIFYKKETSTQGLVLTQQVCNDSSSVVMRKFKGCKLQQNTEPAVSLKDAINKGYLKE
jgi:hypothetical protein